MLTTKTTGHLVGALLLCALVIGIVSNFILIEPIFANQGFMLNGAGQAGRFGLIAVLCLFTSVCGLLSAILAWPVLRQSSERLALGVLILTSIGLATTAVEQANFLAMHSLSAQYAAHGAQHPDLFAILRGMVAASRNWIHYLDKLIGAFILTLHLALSRARLVPTWLTLLGLTAAVGQMSAISMALFGGNVPMLMLAPLAFAQITLSLYLMIRGFVAIEPRDQAVSKQS